MSEVDQLADTLLKTGIAFSKAQAKEMAQNMSSTGDKVIKDFDARKEQYTTGKKRDIQAPTPPANNPIVKEAIREIRQHAMEDKPINVQVDYEVPNSNNEQTVKEMLEDAEKKDFSDEERAETEVITPTIQEVEPASESLHQPSDPDPIVNEPEPTPEPVQEEVQEQPAQTVEEPAPPSLEETEPKQDHSDMEESKVNLNDMFNFGKK